TRDCAGINAAIRAVVRTACYFNIEVTGIKRGYEGLINGELLPFNKHSVSGIINLGGTILKTTRPKRFLSRSGQELAAKTIRNHNIDGIIVIGGNGSLTGAHILATEFNIPTIGIPATIDNDINCVSLSLGADTAVNVAMDALDKIRDTATSMERIFVVEVMGRDCGYIALQVALAGGCEEVLVPESEINLENICGEIARGNKEGKVSWIIVVAEGKSRAIDIADTISVKTGLETRVAVLGHIQRGGRPTAIDRIMAARLGYYAVEVIKNGESDKCVYLKDNKPAIIPLEIAIQPKKIEVNAIYKLIKILT
ncbi:ATP-dependent 6-phosphofructokinase, partial [Acidobacteriota bacterium]